jgi:transposase InsO family protein
VGLVDEQVARRPQQAGGVARPRIQVPHPNQRAFAGVDKVGALKAARIEVGKWIEDRYNRRRRHASIGQISPVAFELQYSHQIADTQEAA